MEQTMAGPPHEAGSEACYPAPKSSYYFGPPDDTRAFGQPVTGTIGRHLPKEIVRYVCAPPPDCAQLTL